MEAAGSYRIEWSIRARKGLFAIYEHIAEDSVMQAGKIVDVIEKAVEQLCEHPLKYAPDKYKRNNDGSYRAFQKYKYRVAYRVLKEEIRIVSIRHASRRPLFY